MTRTEHGYLHPRSLCSCVAGAVTRPRHAVVERPPAPTPSAGGWVTPSWRPLPIPWNDHRRSPRLKLSNTPPDVFGYVVTQGRPSRATQRSVRPWRWTLLHFEPIASLPVCEVNTPQILEIIESYWLTIPRSTALGRSRMSHIMKWSISKGLPMGLDHLCRLGPITHPRRTSRRCRHPRTRPHKSRQSGLPQ